MALMFGLIGGVLRVSPPLTLGRVHALTTRCAYSPERLRRLGIVPRVGVREGLRRTVAWYRTHGML
jgi:nucleoside-diphosphate-sugar epimerase